MISDEDIRISELKKEFEIRELAAKVKKYIFMYKEEL
jgi:hypothetical protein